MHGFDGPDIVTTDRCCAERKFWYQAFNLAREDIVLRDADNNDVNMVKVSKISKVTSLMVEDEESVLHREQYLISKSGGQVMLDCSDFSDIEGDVQVNWTHQRGKYFEHGRLLS